MWLVLSVCFVVFIMVVDGVFFLVDMVFIVVLNVYFFFL